MDERKRSAKEAQINELKKSNLFYSYPDNIRAITNLYSRGFPEQMKGGYIK